MDLQERLNYITEKLDNIWGKYKDVPGFEHPLYPERSPSKQEWPEEFPTGEYYRWRLIFDVGDTMDTSGLLLRYFPDNNYYRIIFGKAHNSTDEETSNFDDILCLFEYCIQEHIIGSRPPKEN